MKNDILKKMHELICKITKQDNLIIDLSDELDSNKIGMTSIDIVTLIMELEEYYDISFGDVDIKIRNIKSIIEYIENSLKRKKDLNDELLSIEKKYFD